MSAFNNLKQSRKSDFERIQRQIEQAQKGGSGGKDLRYWQPTVDKAGNGYAVIRFLPAPKDEDVSFVRLFSHGFKGPTGKWYIENSLTTLGRKDPVSELNSELWNSTEDDESPARKQARAQKRRLSYISNIYVVNDPACPENNGKVFLYAYGQKIWNKIQAAMYPEFQDETPMNPFDLWEGANFKLKIRQVAGYRNYDSSEFDRPSQLLASDDELESVYNQEYSLQAEVAEDKFKSYEELEKQLNTVLGNTGSVAGAARKAEELPAREYQPRARAQEERKLPEAEAPKMPAASPASDDPDLDFFEQLAKS